MNGASLHSVNSAGGALIAGGQDFVKVDDQLWVVNGDSVTSHSLDLHAAATMSEGSDFVKIETIEACINGNSASCGHTADGNDWVKVES